MNENGHDELWQCRWDLDELLDIEGMDAERAAQLIMTARAPWFVGEE